MNILNADALEVSWREFVGADSENDEVVIFANPPFTSNQGQNSTLKDEQKIQLKRFGLSDNLDMAFLCKASEEGMVNGMWIVNANAPLRQYKVLNSLNMHIELGEVHVGDEIISNGSQPERWLATGEGITDIKVISSSSRLTDWVDCLQARKQSKTTRYSNPVEGAVEVNYYSAANKGVKCWSDRFDEMPEGNEYWMIGRYVGSAMIRAINNKFVGGPYVFVNPTEWTKKAYKSKVFQVWVKSVETNNGASGDVTMTISHSINTFPLFQGDDLDHYNDMSDDEIFQELYQKYQALIKK